MILLIIFGLLLSSPSHASVKTWCAKHLVADDPYEFENVRTDVLTRWLADHESRVAWIELYSRLSLPETSEAEKLEILKVLADKNNNAQTK